MHVVRAVFTEWKNWTVSKLSRKRFFFSENIHRKLPKERFFLSKSLYTITINRIKKAFTNT